MIWRSSRPRYACSVAGDRDSSLNCLYHASATMASFVSGVMFTSLPA
jgi:hypothetical protein